ncbi:hypothetical protein, partial [Cryobacterium sp. Y82]|uniref:hypothetical protein n=1 Tax=Cryobacterium sp. Y82 TaxID=2045017 RepID=UPI001E52AB9B
MLVWVTEWQVAEEHLLIAVGDFVDFTLYPANIDWLARLFGDRPAVEWQFDTYGDAVDQPSLRVKGKVDGLMSARCRQVQTTEGLVPVTGAAKQQSVADTSGSWMRQGRFEQSETSHGADARSHHGSYENAHADDTTDLYG